MAATLLGPVDTAVWKVAFQFNRETISRQLKCEEFCSILYQKDLLSQQEHEHLQQKRQNEGETARCYLLLDFVGKKISRELSVIIEELRLFDNSLLAVVETTVRGINDGSVDIEPGRVMNDMYYSINTV